MLLGWNTFETIHELFVQYYLQNCKFIFYSPDLEEEARTKTAMFGISLYSCLTGFMDDLRPNTTYIVRVIPYNSHGDGPLSKEFFFKTKGNLSPQLFLCNLSSIHMI